MKKFIKPNEQNDMGNQVLRKQLLHTGKRKNSVGFCNHFKTLDLIEIDNTSGSEEIRITHKTGSYIKFLEDGTIELKSLKKTRVI